MSGALDRLAECHGITLEYHDQLGHHRVASEPVKRALLRAVGVPVPEAGAEPGASERAAMEQALAEAPAPPEAQVEVGESQRCFLPDCLRRGQDGGRIWGIALQLYQLRSTRNWGIGDFEDLAHIAEVAAARGADFLGTNPLHALFLAEPRHCSPFSPSNRRFLNPLYIAVDRLPWFEKTVLEEVDPGLAELKRLRDRELVDYAAVARLKLEVLRRLWGRWRQTVPEEGSWGHAAFDAFRGARGTPLARQALFEALSLHFVAQGRSAGWHGWPHAYRDPDNPEVARFAAEQAEELAFQAWLQWLADRQLEAAKQRALAAGMRVGLYLDLAVGDAPDGSATWADQALMVTGARIGAPPDSFNIAGQDWGLSPLSPVELRRRRLEPYRAILDEVMRHAGALRIDHAMGLRQLFFIPSGMPATEGAYVHYPLKEMLEALATASRHRRALVIGEDLGTVPHGFREIMAAAEIHSYRLLYFERLDYGLKAPEDYPRKALACLATHDLPPLVGWWHCDDVALQLDLGFMDEAMAEGERKRRRHDHKALLDSLRSEGLLPSEVVGALQSPDAPVPALDALACALHAHLARAPSRLFAIRLEDLAGERLAVNVPGTVEQHPNWQRRLRVSLEELRDSELFRAITERVAAERPRR